MVFDFFLFNNEVDALELRLRELYPVVDRFFLVESRFSFAGEEKPLHFNTNREKFSKFNDKIFHIVLNEFPHGLTPVERQNYQRDYGFEIVKKHKSSDNDAVTICDVSEIPRPQIINDFRSDPGIWTLRMEEYAYRLNWLCMVYFCEKPKLLTFEMIGNRSPNFVRDYVEQLSIERAIVHPSGWNVRYLGNSQFVLETLRCQGKTNITIEDIEYSIRTKSLLKQNSSVNFYHPMPLENLPMTVKQNVEYYISKGLLE